MRVALNVTIIRISHPPRSPPKNTTVICPSSVEYTKEIAQYKFIEAWSEQDQSFALSSFYIGYLITHLPGGLLCEKFGGKWILCLGILSTAVFTVFTPESIVQGGLPALISLRILTGLGEGTTFPALSNLLSQWIPLRERGTIGSFVFGGGQMGTIVGNSLGGVIQNSLPWDYVYYIFAIIGFIWCLCFVSI